MYIYCRLSDLVLLAHVFAKAIIETSQIHSLFIQYPNNTYFSMLEFS
jgi:hypothetical protein